MVGAGLEPAGGQGESNPSSHLANPTCVLPHHAMVPPSMSHRLTSLISLSLMPPSPEARHS